MRAQATWAGPLILIVVGTLFLMNNLGFGVPLGYLFRKFWPLFLIVPGVLNILGSMSGGSARAHGAFTGGVVMVVIGALFLLQTLFHVGFGYTWPIILIALGVAGLLRFTGAGMGSRTSSSWNDGGSR